MAITALTQPTSVIEGQRIAEWTLGSNNQGKKVDMSECPDKTFMFSGDFSTSGSATLRGSNKENPVESTDTDWFDLTDAGGNAITKTAVAGGVIMECPRWISPKQTAGSGSIIVTVVGKN